MIFNNSDAAFRAAADGLGPVHLSVYMHRIPSRRIVIGGFPHGCAMSLMTGLRYSLPLAGIAGLSGYLPLAGPDGEGGNRGEPRGAGLCGHGEG